jgi:hypothetical protein
MIIESLVSNRKNLLWTMFHVLLGLVCTITPFALIGWFYFLFFTNINKCFQLLKKRNLVFIVALFSYLISFEVLDRMAKTSPFIPYELGKYMLVLLGLLGIFYLGIRSQRGIIMALLITPALFYDFSEQRVLADIINYYLGPLAVGLGITFADRNKITEKELDQILKLIYLASIATLIFTFIKTPDFDEIEFKLGANFKTTGGHSSNQVSTLLGLGMFLSFYNCYNRKLFSGYFLLDVLFLMGFTFQGLLSFSRGGMLVGFFSILIHVISGEKSLFKNGKAFAYTIIGILLFLIVFNFANGITKGNLSLRYQGETEGTLLGSKEKTADNFVTGRLGIFEKDIELFFKYPITGVGLGSSKYLREEGEKVASHVEFSRLLADHGVLGIIYNILLFGIIVIVYKENKQQNILLVLVFMALATTFHAAMRTFVTPLFLIVGTFVYVPSKNKKE